MDKSNSFPNKTIGVLAGWPLYDALGTQNFLDSVLRGIRVAARELNCHLLIACGLGSARDGDLARPAWPVPADDSTFIPVGPWNTDGLIVINPLLSPARSVYIQKLRKQGHPIVFLGTAEKGSAVALDNEGGIRQALHHLVEHGHRSIAFIAGNPADGTGDSGERLQAYSKFMEEFGLSTDKQLVAYGYHTVQGGEAAMKTLLNSEVQYTAVLASNDESAIGAMNVLHNNGIHVPHDLAVVGFDDRPTAFAQNPPLTTVHNSTFERGYRALGLLIGIVNQPHYAQDNIIVDSSSHLVIRESCGCQPDMLFERTLQTTTQLQSDTEHAALLNMMASPVLTGARRLGTGQLFGMCHRLFDAFSTSIERKETDTFQYTFNSILHEIARVGENIHAWQTAIMIAAEYFSTRDSTPTKEKQLIQSMQRWAQATISRCIQQQYRTYMIDQSSLAGRIGTLNANLVETTSADEIYDVLARYLPDIGIEHAAIAYFDGETAVATTQLNLYPIMNSGNNITQIPVHGLYADTLLKKDMAHHLALFPLIVDQEQIGFAMFKTENFAICETIVRQIASALRNARLYQETREARRLAEEANQMKDRFLSMVSHELRTPLSLIVGLSEMLLDDQQKGQLLLDVLHTQQVERIHINAQHLDSLIQDVLDLTHGDMNQLSFEPEPLILQDVLVTVLSIGQQMAIDKGLQWRQNLPEESIFIHGDRGRLRQVMLNLVNNAIKFTATGEIFFSMNLIENATMVEINVTDTGVGVPEEERQTIFKPFHQSQRTAQRGYGGMGLGLAICKHLVHLHKGNIGLHAGTPSHTGSSFYVRLPVLLTKSYLEQTTNTTHHPLTESYILVIEPVHSPSEILINHLMREGHQVRTINDEVDEDILTSMTQDPPHAIVFDMRITSNHGWKILRRLKNNISTQDIPLLFFELEQTEDTGIMMALDYMSKPVGTSELAQALQRYAPLKNTKQKNFSILIVDDDVGILEMHTQMIRKQWPMYQIYEARHGREALDMMRKNPPDLVLLDLMMPELDGFAVLKTMRKEESLRHIPVIVLTAQILTAEEMKHLHQGVATILKKGVFTVEETLNHIQEALSHTEKSGGEIRRMVRHAMAYIHEHFAEHITREDIALHIGVSKGYLSRSFRGELGISPITYLNRYRVNQAKLLLVANRQSIAEIAYAVGFPDRSYFSRVFRKEVGQTPKAYQKNNVR